MSKKRRAQLVERRAVCAQVRDRDRGCRFHHHIDRWPSDLPLPAFPLGCTGPLDCHEIIPRSAWAAGWLEPSNIVLVCRLHHDWIGEHPDAAHLLGLHGYSYERPA